MKHYSDWPILHKFLIPLASVIVPGALVVALMYTGLADTMQEEILPTEARLENIRAMSQSLLSEYREYIIAPDPEVLEEIRDLKEKIEPVLGGILAEDVREQVYPTFRSDIEPVVQSYERMAGLGGHLISLRDSINEGLEQLERDEVKRSLTIGKAREAILKEIGGERKHLVFERLVAKSLPELENLHHIEWFSLSQLSETREFIISGDPGTLDELKEIQARLDERLKTLAATARSNPAAAPFLPRIETTLQALKETSAGMVRISQEMIGTRGELEAAENALEASLENSLGRFHAFVEQAAEEGRIRMLLTIFAVLVACIIVIVLVSRYTVAPLVALRETAARFGGGALDARAKVSGRDEVGALAAAFNTMAGDLKESIVARENAEEQLRHSQKMEVVGQLAGGIAHEFNNLLQIISGYTSLVLADKELPDNTRSRLSPVESSAKRAAQLTGELLAFSRQEILETHPLDLGELVTNQLEIMRRILGESITFKMPPPAKGAIVKGDAGALGQVVFNLCINARDAMPQGGHLAFDLRIIEPDSTFRTRHAWAQEERYALFSVSDTGSGMAPEVLEHIFEPFFTTKEVGQGSGLGLSMVYGIVQQHHGMIEVESKPGIGTGFRLYFPVIATDGIEARKAAGPIVPGGGETILIAEDEEAVRVLAAHLLESKGYTVLKASNGQEALALFADQPDAIDMALLDVAMPGMGGRELHEKLLEIKPSLRVIFNTGYAADTIDSKYLLENNLKLIQKPYLPNELFLMVREVLDQGR